jgi:hypothetical protein
MTPLGLPSRAGPIVRDLRELRFVAIPTVSCSGENASVLFPPRTVGMVFLISFQKKTTYQGTGTFFGPKWAEK